MNATIYEYPLRHARDMARARRAAARIRWFHPNPDDIDPTSEQIAALGRSLCQGDPAADQLMDWMHEHEHRERWAMVQQVLDKGLDSLPSVPPAVCDIFCLHRSQTDMGA